MPAADPKQIKTRIYYTRWRKRREIYFTAVPRRNSSRRGYYRRDILWLFHKPALTYTYGALRAREGLGIPSYINSRRLTRVYFRSARPYVILLILIIYTTHPRDKTLNVRRRCESTTVRHRFAGSSGGRGPRVFTTPSGDLPEWFSGRFSPGFFRFVLRVPSVRSYNIRSTKWISPRSHTCTGKQNVRFSPC